MKADFGSILEKAFGIAIKSKWLWVYAILLAGSAGFGSFSNYSRLASFNSSEEDTTALNSVLETTSSATAVFKTFENIENSIPPHFYVFLILFTVVIILASIVLSVYIFSFAESSLISGISLESDGTKALLSNTAPYGRRKTMEVIKLNIISYLSIAGVVIIFALPFILISLIMTALPIIGLVFSLLLLFIVPFAILAFLYVNIAFHLGTIAVVFDDVTWQEGIKRGFRVVKKFFFDVVVMGLLNCVIGAVFGIATFVAIIPPILIIVLSIFGVIANPVFSIILFPVCALLIILLIIISALLNGITYLFNYSTWTLFYKQLREGI